MRIVSGKHREKPTHEKEFLGGEATRHFSDRRLCRSKPRSPTPTPTRPLCPLPPRSPLPPPPAVTAPASQPRLLLLRRTPRKTKLENHQVVVYGYHPILRRRYRAFPGPRPKWLRGNVDEVVKRHIFGAYDFWEKQFGQLFLCWLGSRPVVVTTHGPTAKRIMLRQPTRPPLAGPAEIPFSRDNRYLEHDLLTTQDPAYHRSLKRTGWLPAFRGASIAQSAACMDAGARELVARLGRVADLGEEPGGGGGKSGGGGEKASKEINLWRMMGEVTLDVVFRAAFGIELGTQQDAARRPERASRLIEAAKAVFEVGQRSTRYFVVAQAFPPLRPLVRVLATLFPDAALRRVTAARGLVFRTVEQLLAEKKRERARKASASASAGTGVSSAAAAPAPTPPSSSSSRPPSAVAPGCFIDSLLDATHDDGSPWHDDEIVEACLTFALAAYETTATAISFACYGLCLNPRAREKVAAQLDARPVDAKSPAELLETFAEDYPLVDACLAEALRLWPPGAITIRKAATDDDGRGNTEVFGLSSSGEGGSLSSKRYLVPKGTWMHCCIWSIHRDASVWPRAQEFLPERFLSPPQQQQQQQAHKAAGKEEEEEAGKKKGGGEEGTPLDLYAASAEARSHYYFPFGDGALSCVGR